MVERKAKFFALFFGKALVESLDKSFGIRLFLCLAKQGRASGRVKPVAAVAMNLRRGKSRRVVFSWRDS